MGATGQVAGAALDLYSLYKGGQQAKSASDTNAKILESNAAKAREDGIWAQEVTERKLTNFLRAKAQDASSKRVKAGASGVDSTVGSPAEARESDRKQVVEDANTIIKDGDKAQRDAEFKAVSFENQAAVERFSGKQAEEASWWNMGSTALSSGSSIYKNYKLAKDRGVNPWV